MSPQELNRDIKRLWKRFEKVYGKEGNEGERRLIQDEWKRLWYADQDANNMKVEQLKAMIRINNCMRYKPLHTIGLLFEPKL